MSKIYKPISHFERRNNPACRPKKVVVTASSEGRLVVYDEVDPVTNRIVRKSEFKTIDRQKEMENYSCSDFSLENMLAVGVDIKPTKLSSSGFAMLDNMEHQVAKMSNDIKNSINQNQNAE